MLNFMKIQVKSVGALFVTGKFFRIKLAFLSASWISSQLLSAYLPDALSFSILFYSFVTRVSTCPIKK